MSPSNSQETYDDWCDGWLQCCGLERAVGPRAGWNYRTEVSGDKRVLIPLFVPQS